MYIVFFVEEPSAETALRNLIPVILDESVAIDVHVYQGKPDLLAKLPIRLRGYANWLPADYRIVVLVDRDNDDCFELKEQLEEIAADAGLVTRTAAGKNAPFQILNRIAIEELEAWFFGDMEALVQAYPRIPRTLHRRRPYRDPDSIRGGTWEALERVLKRAGYYRTGLLKREAADFISRHMDPDRNRSKSFQVFRDGLRAMMA